MRYKPYDVHAGHVPSDVDARFQYKAKQESKGGQKQSIYSTEVSYIEPTNVLEENVRQIDFDITTKRPVMFEHNTKLEIQGFFQRRAAADNSEWETIPAADAANVVVEPNWWEKLLRSPGEVYNNHQLIKTSDEPNYVPFHLNTFLYWSMEPTFKKLLCPQPCHPGNGIPTKANDWDRGVATSNWRVYAPEIFKATKISFTWVPLFVFPFYQGSNWILNGDPPGCVPINTLGKFTYRLTFRDNQDYIFKKPDTNTYTYRFKLEKIRLMIEEVRMNPALERTLYTTGKRSLSFPGVTKLARVETVPAAVYTHNVKFENIHLPEGIFIFALNKKVVGGTYKYNDAANGPLFSQHNLTDTNVEFAGVKYALVEPNMFQVNKDSLDLKLLLDYLGDKSPFGIMTDEKKFNLPLVANGFSTSDFPHVYYNLCVGNGRDRMVPALTDDANLVTKMGDLTLQLKFGANGAPADLIYIVYIFYTDVNVMLDQKNKRFISPHGLR
jgi:hypothetical protein